MKKESKISILTNKKQRATWLASLPLAHHDQLEQILCETINELTHAVIPPHQRFIALEDIAEPLSSLLVDFKQQQYTTTFPCSDKHLSKIDRFQSLLSKMSYSYIATLESLSARGYDGAESSFFTIATFRAMQLNLTQQYLSYTSYHQPEEETWANLNKLYHLAFSKHIHQEAVMPGPLDLVKAENIENLYKQALLLALASPNQLSGATTMKLTTTLVYWAQYCHLYDAETPDRLHGLFAIKLNEAVPPKAAKDYDLSCGYGLYFDTSNLLIRLSQIISRPGVQLLPEKVKDLINTSPLPCMKRIYKSWGKLGKRAFKRRNTHAHVQLTIGFNAIHQLLSHHQERDHTHTTPASLVTPKFETKYVANVDGSGIYPDTLDFDQIIETDTITRKQYGAAAQIPKEISFTTHSTEAKVIDESAGGYCLSIKRHTRHSISVGDLVCCHYEPGKLNLFTICVVRWMKETDKELMFGIEVISPFAEAIQLTEIIPNQKNDLALPGLLLPQIVSLDKAASIISSSSTNLKTDCEYFLKTMLEKQIITVEKTLDSTGSFNQFSYNAEIGLASKKQVTNIE